VGRRGVRVAMLRLTVSIHVIHHDQRTDVKRTMGRKREEGRRTCQRLGHLHCFVDRDAFPPLGYVLYVIHPAFPCRSRGVEEYVSLEHGCFNAFKRHSADVWIRVGDERLDSADVQKYCWPLCDPRHDALDAACNRTYIIHPLAPTLPTLLHRDFTTNTYLAKHPDPTTAHRDKTRQPRRRGRRLGRRVCC
jgi:hypothetical protein